MKNEYILPDKDKIAYRVIDGEAIVINLKNSELNILNPVATFIWEHLNGSTQIKEIVRMLSEEFEVDYKTAEKDCMDFISQIRDKGIVILPQQ